MGADLSYLLAVIFTVLFLVAWWMAKKGQGTRHHKLALVSMISLLTYFVAYYYARNLGALAAEGKEGFGGPLEVYNSVFLPVLYTHLTLVTLGLILAPYMIVEGYRACVKMKGEYVLKPGELKADPKKFTRIWLWLLGLWAVVEVLCLVAGKPMAGTTGLFSYIYDHCVSRRAGKTDRKMASGRRPTAPYSGPGNHDPVRPDPGYQYRHLSHAVCYLPAEDRDRVIR